MSYGFSTMSSRNPNHFLSTVTGRLIKQTIGLGKVEILRDHARHESVCRIVSALDGAVFYKEYDIAAPEEYLAYESLAWLHHRNAEITRMKTIGYIPC